MRVDSVKEVVNLDRSEIEVSAKICDNNTSKFVHGVAYRHDELIILIELSELLTKEEWQTINET